jgi:hypothetical protein
MTDILFEDEDNSSSAPKRMLMRMIISNFYRFINAPDRVEIRSILLLISALSVISAAEDDDRQALMAARRLVQSALSRRRA